MQNKGEQFYNYGLKLYDAFLQEAPAITVPAELVGIAGDVCRKIGWHPVINGIEYDFKIADLPENNRVLIALSGGLDSVYLMHKLKDAGYDVTAVHVAGLNKSSASLEEAHATKAARLAGVHLIKAVFDAPRQAFPDNPFKNQLVLSMMLAFGVKRGIYRFAVGSDWLTPLSEAVTGYTITDSAEVYRAFWAGVQAHFPQAELMFIDNADRKGQRLKYLFERHPASLRNVSSCIAPQRFRAHLHETNIKKYRIPLMPDRCGSCYKCAMEYLLLVEYGLIPKNEQYYSHCWHTLATSKTAHRPDLFALSLPLPKRIENLKNYGS